MEDRYLYRGTTEGWPGRPVLPGPDITCTTTDPLVATLFAIECRNQGRAVLLAARRNLFGDLIGSANYFDMIESAVNLLCSPLEFAKQAEVVMDVDKAIEILGELGFVDLPARLSGKGALQMELEQTHLRGLRLNEEQRDLFNARMLGLSHDQERA